MRRMEGGSKVAFQDSSTGEKLELEQQQIMGVFTCETEKSVEILIWFCLFTVHKLISVTSQKQVVLLTKKEGVVRAGREEGIRV